MAHPMRSDYELPPPVLSYRDSWCVVAITERSRSCNELRVSTAAS